MSIASALEQLRINLDKLALSNDSLDSERGCSVTTLASLPTTPRLDEYYQLAFSSDVQVPWHAEHLTVYGVTGILARQVGYRWHAMSPSKAIKGWNPDWVVIGDAVADPIFADTAHQEPPVLAAIHGVGNWNPFEVAPSIELFVLALNTWVEVCLIKCKGRFLNEDFELNPDVRADLEKGLGPILPPNDHRFWLGAE